MADTTVVRSVRMSSELWAFVIERAKAKDIPVNAWMIRCVEDARKRMEAKSAPIGPVERKPGAMLKKR